MRVLGRSFLAIVALLSLEFSGDKAPTDSATASDTVIASLPAIAPTAVATPQDQSREP